MGRTREFDIDNAVGIAADLFWRKGYDGASISELTRNIGITPPSFYFAFGSKDALFEKIVETYRALQSTIVEAALEQTTAKGVVESLLFGYVDLIATPGHAPGCLILNSSLPVIDGHPFRSRFAEERKALRHRLKRRFNQFLQHKDKLPGDADPAELAHLVVALLWGLAVEAQSGATRQELRKAVAAAVRLLPA